MVPVIFPVSICGYLAGGIYVCFSDSEVLWLRWFASYSGVSDLIGCTLVSVNMPNDCCTTACCIDDGSCESLQALKRHSLVRQMCASSIASIVSTLSLNPITVIKVRLQNLSAPSSASAGSSSSGLRGVIRTVMETRGIGGFWAGTRMGIMMSVPNTVLYMSVYENLKENLPAQPMLKPVQTFIPAIAGALARMISVTIITPLELIRTIQTGGVPDSITNIARSIIRDDGIRGLYRGWVPSVLRDCPFSAIYWLGFETLRPVYAGVLLDTLPSGNTSTPILSNTAKSSAARTTTTAAAPNYARDGYPSMITFLSGATAGMIAAVCTHPFDVLKTRRQVAAWHVNSNNNLAAAEALTAGVTTGSASAAVNVQSVVAEKINLTSLYRSGGVSGLYRGLTMRLATVIPASAIMITTYEAIKSLDI